MGQMGQFQLWVETVPAILSQVAQGAGFQESVSTSLTKVTTFFKNLFICLFLFLAALGLRCCTHGLSLVAASGGYSSLWCTGFSLCWLLLLWSTGSRRAGFSSCGVRAQQLWLAGSRAQAQQFWHMGLDAPRHVGSSWTRAQTHVPCIGRQILNHCATREVLFFYSFYCFLKFFQRILLYYLVFICFLIVYFLECIIQSIFLK